MLCNSFNPRKKMFVDVVWPAARARHPFFRNLEPNAPVRDARRALLRNPPCLLPPPKLRTPRRRLHLPLRSQSLRQTALRPGRSEAPRSDDLDGISQQHLRANLSSRHVLQVLLCFRSPPTVRCNAAQKPDLVELHDLGVL